MRKKIISWGTKALFAILILSFGMWGMSDYSQYQSPNDPAASAVMIGDSVISNQEFSRELRQELQRIKSILGTDLDSDQARAMKLADGVVERLIQRDLFTIAAKNMGLIINDDGVRHEIHGDRQFQGISGQFDSNVYHQALRTNGLSEGAFVDSLRSDLLRSQYLSSIGSGGKVPKVLVDSVYRYRNQQRTASVLRIANESFVVTKTPSQSELKNFYKERAAIFTAPEYRSLTVVELNAGSLMAEIEIPEGMLQTEYNNRLDEFSEVERRKVRQMLIGNETTARLAHERLSKSESFEKVANEIAGMDVAATDLGTRSQRQIPIRAIADAAFKLAKDEFSAPIKTKLGWHILQVQEIIPESQKSFAEVKDQLQKTLARETAIDNLSELANKLEDQMGAGTALESAARNLNLKVTNLDAVSSLGLRPDSKKISGIPGIDLVVRVAFKTPEGEESTLQEIDEEVYFILRVNKIIPPALIPLEKVRTRAIAEWQRVEQAKAAKAEAKRIVVDAASLKDLKSYASEKRVKHHTTANFTRHGIGLRRALPPALIADIFSLKRNELASAAAPDAHYVARVTKIIEANPISDRDGVAAIRAQLAQTYTNDLAQQLGMALRSRHEITINRESIDQAY